MSGEKILVVDDRRENLLFLADSVLRSEGYEVLTAMDGKEALDKALTEKPDLIITDLRMPHMDGLEMMAALRKADANIPVILTTFYGSEQAAIEAFRLGAKDYIVKPYDVAEMLESVERALIEQRLRRETQDLKEGVEVRRHLEERVRQLHSLCGIGKALTALTDPDEVMRVSVEAAIYLTGADSGQLFLGESGTGKLELRAVRGPSESGARCTRQVATDRTAARVLETGQAVTAERSSGSRPAVGRLAVPVRIGDRVIGALAVDAKPAYSLGENDRYQLGILTNFVAVALANAQVIERLKGQEAARSQPADEEPEQAPAAMARSMSATEISELQRLADELQALAEATQLLALQLQAPGEAL
jgi:two-component system NtrC family sensor kinase